MGPECFYDGAIRRSKKFSDRFSRFDTIPAVTDSHPASHVSVAITLNAKASSLKSDIEFENSISSTHSNL